MRGNFFTCAEPMKMFSNECSHIFLGLYYAYFWALRSVEKMLEIEGK